MLEINHRPGYATITNGIEIIARIYPHKSGLFVKSTLTGRDYAVHNEAAALAAIEKELV